MLATVAAGDYHPRQPGHREIYTGMEKKLRIATGIVLYIFITMHLINLALGLHSIALIEAAKPFLTGPWSNPVGGMLLTSAMLVHMALGLGSLYRRNTLLMNRSDTAQLITGLAVLPLLVPHIVGTVAAKYAYGIIPDYPLLIHYFWIGKPSEGLRQVLLLTVAWVHGSIGLFIWLKLRSWWPQYGHWIYPLAVIVPVCALTGFSEAGKEAFAMSAPPQPAGNPVTQAALDGLATVSWWCLSLFAAAVAGVLIARAVRLASHAGETEIVYAGDKTIVALRGLTVLETSRANDIPHASLCNGRGRCGTCRVAILATDHPLPDPGPEEAATLAHFRAPQNVRLACALKPGGGTMTIKRLLPADILPAEVRDFSENAHGTGPGPAEEPVVPSTAQEVAT